MNLNEHYRNGGEINETEPHIYDTVDWFNRAARDPRVVINQLRAMGCPTREMTEQEES